jgi:hypothetical protein
MEMTYLFSTMSRAHLGGSKREASSGSIITHMSDFFFLRVGLDLS